MGSPHSYMLIPGTCRNKLGIVPKSNRRFASRLFQEIWHHQQRRYLSITCVILHVQRVRLQIKAQYTGICIRLATTQY